MQVLIRLLSASSFFCTCWALFFMAAMLMFYLGYQETIAFNDRLEQTTCTVFEHIGPTMHTCSKSCNCQTVCTPRGQYGSSCSEDCDTCTFDCYDASIRVNYTTLEMETFIGTFQVANDRTSEESAQNSLDEYYIGYSFECLYDRDNPGDVRSDERDPVKYLVGAILFFFCSCFTFCLCSVYVIAEVDSNIEEFKQIKNFWV